MAYTNIDDSSAHCQSVRWTGNDTGQGARDFTFTGNSNMQPDMAIAIAENQAFSHMVTDSSRDWSNGNKEWLINGSNIEGDTNAINTGAYGWLGPGLTNGIRMSQAGNYWNVNNKPYYAACWKVNGGTTTSFTESGSNPGGTRQTNSTAGMSIITYTGTGSNGTIAHGLPATPTFIIFKRRDNANVPCVWHQGIGDDYKLVTSNYSAKDADGAFMASTLPTSTNITVGGASVNTNANNGTYMCYAFSPVQGYSKFGSYVGNGNASGPFIYTGFKPAFFLLKKTSGADGWRLFDNKRAGYNDDNYRLAPNATDAEETSTTYLDILSNGVKIRGTAGSFNQSGGTYIYMAFAENPFTTSTGIPTTAR